MTCLSSYDAAAKLRKVGLRVAGTQGPWDLKARSFPFFLSSLSRFFRPCMEGRSTLHPTHSLLRAFLYLSEIQNADLSEQGAYCDGHLLLGLSFE